MRARPRTLAFLGATAGAALLVSGCSVDVPEGKPWTVDTKAWSGSPQCQATPCSLDAYRTRNFTLDAVVPAALTDGDQVQVHCWVPTPAVQRDPRGRDAHTWYLLTVDGELLWAPDLSLTSDDDLRREPADPGDHLGADVVLCHSAVPGR